MEGSNLIAIVDHSEVREGKLEAVKAIIRELVELVGEKEPRILAYNFYLSDDERRITVMQIHPDAASLDDHLEVGAPVFRKLTELVFMQSMHIFGRPGDEALAKLRDKAGRLGGATVTVHEWYAGLSRIGEFDIEDAMKSPMDSQGRNEDLGRKLTGK